MSHFRDTGLPRAAFELECPESSLQVVELSHGSMGVSGCNKKAIYVWAGGQWINNTGAPQSAK